MKPNTLITLGLICIAGTIPAFLGAAMLTTSDYWPFAIPVWLLFLLLPCAALILIYDDHYPTPR